MRWIWISEDGYVINGKIKHDKLLSLAKHPSKLASREAGIRVSSMVVVVDMFVLDDSWEFYIV